MTQKEASSREEEKLPYWLMNVPQDKRPTNCPDFLLDISDRNKELIDRPEDEYHILAWPEVQDLISMYSQLIPPTKSEIFLQSREADGRLGNNQIDKFSRSPTNHRRYLEYMFNLKKDYGSVMDFVRDERLKWTDLKPKAAAFQDPGDDFQL